MIKRYGMLLAVTLVAAVVLGALSRLPRAGARAPAPAEVVVSTALTIELRTGAVHPERSEVVKGRDVALEVVNQTGATVSLALGGYEDRVRNERIEPGAKWAVTFRADRPGDDFVWLVDDKPAGRFAVTGSHLTEGHR